MFKNNKISATCRHIKLQKTQDKYTNLCVSRNKNDNLCLIESKQERTKEQRDTKNLKKMPT